MNTQIIPGSIGAIAKQNGASIAETFLSADAIVLVDTSGSMDATDARAGKSRYQVACDELANLQNTMPGKVAVVAFSDTTVFCPNGVPQFLQSGTDLAGGLNFMHVADGLGLKIILISDGEPNSREQALAAAKRFKSPISTIYVGPEGGPGSQFLKQLAAACGGQAVTAQFAASLADKTQLLIARP